MKLQTHTLYYCDKFSSDTGSFYQFSIYTATKYIGSKLIVQAQAYRVTQKINIDFYFLYFYHRRIINC